MMTVRMSFILLAVVPTSANAQQTLWAIGSSGVGTTSQLYRIDGWETPQPVTHVVGDTGRNLSDLAIHPGTGRLYAIDSTGPSAGGAWLFEIDPCSAATQVVGQLGHYYSNQLALEFDVDGKLWTWGTGSFTDVALVDPNTASVLYQQPTPYPSDGDMAFDVDGQLYGIAGGWIVKIDTGAFGGVSSWLYNFSGGGWKGMEIDTLGRMILARPSTTISSGVEIALFDHRGPTPGFVSRSPLPGAGFLGIEGLALSGGSGFQSYGVRAQAIVLYTSTSWARPGVGQLVMDGPPGTLAFGLFVSSAKTNIAVGNLTLLVDPNGLLAITLPADSFGNAYAPWQLQELQAIQSMVSQAFAIQSNLTILDSAGLLYRTN